VNGRVITNVSDIEVLNSRFRTWSERYLLSLAYLTLLGSVVAFSAFLTLLGRIGADRAGYVTVGVPVVALLISGLFEGLHWNPLLVLGVLLCLAGNVSVMWKRR